ncbi:MAG: ribosome biogenesis GTPase Der, partial [Treponemataceae bacterium]
EADLILLLLDAGNVTGEDEEFIGLLRPYWKKLFAAVNKTEGGRLSGEAQNFYQYGFNELLCISAEHGDNIPELYETIIEKLDFSQVVEGQEEEVIRVAIVGKPNTGKSTLANRLTHSNASIVSDYAGTTRDVVESDFTYKERKFHILDTAGIRRKARVKENVEYYSVNRAIRALDKADIVFHLIDAQEGLAEQDKKIVSLAYERGLGVIFVLNKWDTQDQEKRTFRKAAENMNIMFGQMSYAPILVLSALEGKGIKSLLNEAIELYEQLTRKVDTSALNLGLKDWVTNYPPPASRHGRFKVRYAVQSGVKPVSFLIFATRPEVIPQTYMTFLKNRIREDLGYNKIPILIEFKASRKNWEEYEKERNRR